MLVRVKVLQGWGSYNAGEIIGLLPEQAERAARSKRAVILDELKAKSKSEPKPEAKPEEDKKK